VCVQMLLDSVKRVKRLNLTRTAVVAHKSFKYDCVGVCMCVQVLLESVKRLNLTQSHAQLSYHTTHLSYHTKHAI